MSPKNRTVYVKAEDRDLWAKAERYADRPISVLIADLLRSHVAERERDEEARKTGMERVVVDISDEDQVRSVAFHGRKLTIHLGRAGQMRGAWAIYLTTKGKYAVYHEDAFSLAVYDDFEALAEEFEDEAPDLVARVAEAVGRTYVEELDI